MVSSLLGLHLTFCKELMRVSSSEPDGGTVGSLPGPAHTITDTSMHETSGAWSEWLPTHYICGDDMLPEKRVCTGVLQQTQGTRSNLPWHAEAGLQTQHSMPLLHVPCGPRALTLPQGRVGSAFKAHEVRNGEHCLEQPLVPLVLDSCIQDHYQVLSCLAWSRDATGLRRPPTALLDQ